MDPVKSSGANPRFSGRRGRRGRRRRRGHGRRHGHHGNRHRRGRRHLVGRPREKGFDLPQELLGVERLGNDGVAAEPVGPVPVEGLEGPRQEHHRDPGRGRIRLDGLADLVAVLLRHDDVGQDQVGHLAGLDPVEQPLTVRYTDELVFAVGEGQLHDLLNREAVIGEKYLLCHVNLQ